MTKTKIAVLDGKPDEGNPHVRFDKGEVAWAKPRRGSWIYIKLAILLLVLPLVALADVADPPMPGINEPFPAAFMVAVSLIVGCLILVYRSCRSFVGRLVILPILILCGLVVFLQIRLVFNVNCTACSGRGFVGGRYRETCGCCRGSGKHVRWISPKCQTLSEVEERIRVDTVRKRFGEAACNGENKRPRQREYDDEIE